MNTLISTSSDVEMLMAAKGVRFSPLELKLPENMEMPDWAEIGHKLARSSQVLDWWIGDWAAFGERKYGKLKEFATASGINYGTVRDRAWVSQAVPVSRRRDNLEWSTHREIAALPAKEQVVWLDKIEKESLDRGQLRRQLRLSKGEGNALESEGETLKLGTKYFEDLLGWLKARPAEFWTMQRRAIWGERLGEIEVFRAALGN